MPQAPEPIIPNPAPPTRLTASEQAVLFSCALLFFSLLGLLFVQNLTIVWLIAGMNIFVHFCWCWMLAQNLHRPVRPSFWLAWIPIGLTLAIAGAASAGLLLFFFGPDSNPMNFFSLIAVMAIMSVSILPPFALTRHRSDKALFWLMTYQLPIAIISVIIAGAALFEKLPLDKYGLLDYALALNFFTGIPPILPTLFFLICLRAKRLYGTTPA